VCALFYGVAEASLTCWCHGTCLNFDFQGIDRGGDSHSGCNWRSIMAERRIGSDEDDDTCFFLCVGWLISCSCGLGKRVATLVDCIFWWCSSST
jgi:hypothetical protein